MSKAKKEEIDIEDLGDYLLHKEEMHRFKEIEIATIRTNLLKV